VSQRGFPKYAKFCMVVEKIDEGNSEVSQKTLRYGRGIDTGTLYPACGRHNSQGDNDKTALELLDRSEAALPNRNPIAPKLSP